MPVPTTDLPRLTAFPGGPITGRVAAPGDKSISHRALILAGMAVGTSQIEGLLEGDDVLATARAVQAFGAEVERADDGVWRVTGRPAWQSPSRRIDCGNAGTGVRLLLGAAAGQSVRAEFDGDLSLRRRPMSRVTTPLAEMGARFAWLDLPDRLPVQLEGGDSTGLDFTQSVPSAQVKSAILLAGLRAGGTTCVTEPVPSRDHSERMLRAFGVQLDVTPRGAGWVIRLEGGQTLTATHLRVPGDPSSAAFALAAALITPGSEVTVTNVLLNPLRTGLFQTWQDMGADLDIVDVRRDAGEPVGDVTARYSPLRGVVVPPERAASMIDEYPILAVTAAGADGQTVMRGIGEMRVKESDRIALMAQGLSACGVQVQEEADGLIVEGGPVAGGTTVATGHDHRIAMSHLVLGLAARAPIAVDAPDMIATSFPGFVPLMQGLGADIRAD